MHAEATAVGMAPKPGLRRSFRQLPRWILVLLMAVNLTGCKGPWFGGEQTTQPAVVQMSDSPFRPVPEPVDPNAEEYEDPIEDGAIESPETSGNQPIRRVSVRLNVLRVTAPTGVFTKNTAIWKTVVGALADAGAAACLRDNGIRAAIGRDSDRATLQAILDDLPNHRSGVDSLVPDMTRLVELTLGPCEPNQRVFHYDRAGHLHGDEFENGKIRLRIAYEVRSARLDDVMLQLMPEVEEPPGPMKWVITEAGAAQVEEERRHSFRELVFGGTIPPGGFLMLGPTADIYQQPLLGKALFVDSNRSDGADDADEESRESLLIISPIVTSAGGAAR